MTSEERIKELTEAKRNAYGNCLQADKAKEAALAEYWTAQGEYAKAANALRYALKERRRGR